MPLDIYTNNKSSSIEMPEWLSNLYEKYNLECPMCKKIVDNFYDDIGFHQDHVKNLRSEFKMISDCYINEGLRNKKVSIKDKTILKNIIANIFNKDTVYLKLLELISVCDDAISNDKVVSCCSD